MNFSIMAHRIEIKAKISDTRAEIRKKEINSVGFAGKVDDIQLVDVYTIEREFKKAELERIKSMLTNPVFQDGKVDDAFKPEFNYAIEIGFLPGVTDNVGNTTREGISDLLKVEIVGQAAYYSQLMFLSGKLTREDAQNVGELFANPLIQRIHIKSYEEFFSDNGMGMIIPKVRVSEKPVVTLVDILNANDDELAIIGKQGIANPDGLKRGPLALDLTYMKTIRKYFEGKGRNPTDVELESVAQTWSEHCKHTKFRDPIDNIEEGLFRSYIGKATEEIRKIKGEKDFCVSVFTDNAGAIIFDDDYLITDKVETHNSPSALDTFGGAITGIVGVNRDAIGFGLGAKPIINRYGFCFADPEDEKPLFKRENKTCPHNWQI